MSSTEDESEDLPRDCAQCATVSSRRSVTKPDGYIFYKK